MKKTFRSHILLVIEGRIFIGLIIGVQIYLFKYFYETILEKQLFVFLLYVVYYLFVIWAMKIYVITILYPLAFGKLIISDEGITFRCFLKRPIFISWDNCNYCGIEAYQNVVPDLYNTGRVYLYFSENDIPQKYKGKIDKMKNQKGFIKFFPVTVKLCEEVLKHKYEPTLRRYVIQKSFKK